MTNEEALKALRMYHDVVIGDDDTKISKAMVMAMKALENENDAVEEIDLSVLAGRFNCCCYISYGYDVGGGYFNEEEKKIICDALNRQTPMKPIKKGENRYLCPKCNDEEYMFTDDEKPSDYTKFCSMCGQAFDWKE